MRGGAPGVARLAARRLPAPARRQRPLARSAAAADLGPGLTLPPDVWSLGCLAYELCALEPLYQDRDEEVVARKVRAALLPSPFTRQQGAWHAWRAQRAGLPEPPVGAGTGTVSRSPAHSWLLAGLPAVRFRCWPPRCRPPSQPSTLQTCRCAFVLLGLTLVTLEESGAGWRRRRGVCVPPPLCQTGRSPAAGTRPTPHPPTHPPAPIARS